MNKIVQTVFVAALLALPCAASAAFISFGVNGAGGGGGGGDPTANVLPAYNDTYANWKNAGLLSVGGIPVRSTQCGATVNPSGLTPPVANDDAALITAAIAACASGDVVKLGSGTFQVTQSELPILVNKSITIRGTGNCTAGSDPRCSSIVNVRNGAIADWTISPSTAGANCGVTFASLVVCDANSAVFLLSPSGNFDWGWGGCNLSTVPSGCGSALAADVAQGATTVQVASTTNFSIGMWVLIDEDPKTVTTTNPTGGASFPGSPEFLNSTGSPATMRLANIDTANDYSMAPSRLNQEIHLVSSIGAGPCPGASCTLTFDDPLTLAFRQSGSHNAKVFPPTLQGSSTPNPFLVNAGVENLTITKAPNSAIEMMFCAYCWVKNVEAGTWIKGLVNVGYSVRDQIEFNYVHDCADCENNGTEYPIGVDTASTEVYVVNNILVRGGKGMVGRGSNTAVVAYNYQDDTFYMDSVIGDYWQEMGINGSHFGGTHHFLFEGNWGTTCDGDETHGNAIYHVFFRNQCTGIRTTFVDPSTGKTVNDTTLSCWTTGQIAQDCGPERAAGPMAFNYWYAYVGNVLGLSGTTTAGNGWSYQCANVGGGSPIGTGNQCIWMSGWVGAEWPGADSHLIAAAGSAAYIFRHGDYDYFNGSIADWTGGFSHTLPDSFFLASAPSFFTGTACTYPWPWVTPTAGSPLQSPTGPGGCSTASGLPAKARWDAGTPFVQP